MVILTHLDHQHGQKAWLNRGNCKAVREDRGKLLPINMGIINKQQEKGD